jgi:hypothetical protein
MTFSCHTDWVNSIIIYDSLLFSASKDGSINVWAAATGQLLRKLSLPLAIDNTCLVVSNGKLFSGGDDGNILAWDVENETHSVVYAGLECKINCLAAINQNVLVCGTSDGSVKMFTTGDEGNLALLANSISKSIVSTKFTEALSRSKAGISSIFGGDNPMMNMVDRLTAERDFEPSNSSCSGSDIPDRFFPSPSTSPSSSPAQPSALATRSAADEELDVSEDVLSKHKRLNSRLKKKVSTTLSQLSVTKVNNINLFQSELEVVKKQLDSLTSVKNELDIATELLVSYQTELQYTQEAHKSAILLLCDHADSKLLEASIDLDIFSAMLDFETSGLFYLPKTLPMLALQFSPKRVWTVDEDWDSDQEADEPWWRTPPPMKKDYSSAVVAKNYYSGRKTLELTKSESRLSKLSFVRRRPDIGRYRQSSSKSCKKSSELSLKSSSWLIPLTLSSIVGSSRRESNVETYQTSYSTYEPAVSIISTSSWLPPISLSNMIRSTFNDVEPNEGGHDIPSSWSNSGNSHNVSNTLDYGSSTHNSNPGLKLSTSSAWLASTFSNVISKDNIEISKSLDVSSRSLEGSSWIPSIFSPVTRTVGGSSDAATSFEASTYSRNAIEIPKSLDVSSRSLEGSSWIPSIVSPVRRTVGGSSDAATSFEASTYSRNSIEIPKSLDVSSRSLECSSWIPSIFSPVTRNGGGSSDAAALFDASTYSRNSIEIPQSLDVSSRSLEGSSWIPSIFSPVTSNFGVYSDGMASFDASTDSRNTNKSSVLDKRIKKTLSSKTDSKVSFTTPQIESFLFEDDGYSGPGVPKREYPKDNTRVKAVRSKACEDVVIAVAKAEEPFDFIGEIVTQGSVLSLNSVTQTASSVLSWGYKAK